MTNIISSPDLETAIRDILDARTQDFTAIANLSGLDSCHDFAGASLQKTNLSTGDFSQANFERADLRGAISVDLTVLRLLSPKQA